MVWYRFEYFLNSSDTKQDSVSSRVGEREGCLRSFFFPPYSRKWWIWWPRGVGVVPEPPGEAGPSLLGGSKEGDFQCQPGVYPSWGNTIFSFVGFFKKTNLEARKFAKTVQRVYKSLWVLTIGTSQSSKSSFGASGWRSLKDSCYCGGICCHSGPL